MKQNPAFFYPWQASEQEYLDHSARLEALRFLEGHTAQPKRAELERLTAEIRMIAMLGPNFVLHFQANVHDFLASGYLETRVTRQRHVSGGYGKMEGRSMTTDLIGGIFAIGRKRLIQLDAHLNSKIVVDTWRYSPFRMRWFAYPEISSQRLHYHLLLRIHPDVLLNRMHIVEAAIRDFNEERCYGGSLELHTINNWRRQIAYATKQIGHDALYPHIVRSDEFAPESALVPQSGRWIERKREVPLGRLPRLWMRGKLC